VHRKNIALPGITSARNGIPSENEILLSSIILDDRRDVWEATNISNLIQTVPYIFFQGTAMQGTSGTDRLSFNGFDDDFTFENERTYITDVVHNLIAIWKVP
jgi:hypothetical protein